MRFDSMTFRLAAVLAAVLIVGCARDAAPPADGADPSDRNGQADMTAAEHDEYSYSEPDKVRTQDLALQLDVDFDARELSGSATYTLDWLDDEASELILDTRDLTVDKVVGERSDGRWDDLEFELAAADENLGSKLTIAAPQRNPRIRVSYSTSPEASGLQWLTPAMTEGGKTPFMFSQSQQIHARSWVPVQDTTRIRFTYTANVTAPDDVMVLMSADNDPEAERDGNYRFEMPQPIPSYLLAIAAGDLVFEPISERAGVWAEPAAVEAAVAEFADTEKMIEVTEELYGPYRWGRYDLLILPPSFPYGGMENPRLSFITPTVIVGDQSLVALIAHELAHSWSGNLVTFSTSNDAWLNEGVTSYVENRIIEELYGKARADMENAIARNELAVEFETVDPGLQRLALEPGTLDDPDGTSSATVYTKGAWFMQFLEQRFGRETFDAFLRGYFDHFAFQSIPTTEFIAYTQANLLEPNPDTVSVAELEEWIYEPGIPENAPQADSPRFAAVDDARRAWLDDGTLPEESLTSEWTTQEWVHFLEDMPETLEIEQLEALDAAYGFTGTPNGEFAQRWYPLAVRSDYRHANDAIEGFLVDIGRRKLIMPTYVALAETPEGLERAEAILAEARPGYHPITTGSVEDVIADAKATASDP